MILITVGTELPFDRLIRTVDEWARENNRTDVFAQIGEGGWEPRFIRFSHFIDPPAFNRLLSSASAIVSHAGVGSILTAIHFQKPIIVMPRIASLGEHRNEHQMATAMSLARHLSVEVALNERELVEKLTHLEQFTVESRISPVASPELRMAIANFIHHE